MREKYFEDLYLDDGSDILNKFRVNIDEILQEYENNDENEKENDKKESNK